MLPKLRSTLVCTIAFLFGTVSGAQMFPSGNVVPVAGSPRLMVTADFNRDGHPDIVYQDAYEGGSLHVLLGNGDGTFKTGQVIPLDDAVGSVITVGDVNGDGIPDLAIGYNGHAAFTSNPYANPSISILLGKGDGTFQALISNPAYTYGSPYEMNYRMGIADFNGDGHPDLIYSDGYGYIYFMAGDGKGHLANPVEIPGGGEDIYVADLNGDGKPDLVNGNGSGFNVFLGNGMVPSNLPRPIVSTPTV